MSVKDGRSDCRQQETGPTYKWKEQLLKRSSHLLIKLALMLLLILPLFDKGDIIIDTFLRKRQPTATSAEGFIGRCGRKASIYAPCGQRTGCADPWLKIVRCWRWRKLRVTYIGIDGAGFMMVHNAVEYMICIDVEAYFRLKGTSPPILMKYIRRLASSNG